MIDKPKYEILFRNHGDGPAYYTVTQVNYQMRCTCYEFKMSRVRCKHTQTVIREEMRIDNQIIRVSSLRETIEAAQLAFYGSVPRWNPKPVNLFG